jgi:hypothetical protein
MRVLIQKRLLVLIISCFLGVESQLLRQQQLFPFQRLADQLVDSTTKSKLPVTSTTTTTHSLSSSRLPILTTKPNVIKGLTTVATTTQKGVLTAKSSSLLVGPLTTSTTTKIATILTTESNFVTQSFGTTTATTPVSVQKLLLQLAQSKQNIANIRAKLQAMSTTTLAPARLTTRLG